MSPPFGPLPIVLSWKFRSVVNVGAAQALDPTTPQDATRQATPRKARPQPVPTDGMSLSSRSGTSPIEPSQSYSPHVLPRPASHSQARRSTQAEAQARSPLS